MRVPIPRPNPKPKAEVPNHAHRRTHIRLVVVAVAEVALEGVEDVADLEVGALGAADLAHVHHGVHGQGRAVDIVGAAADGRAAVHVVDLPLAERVVHVQVVHEERRVAGRRDGVSHQTTDTVVALSVEAGNSR